MSEQPQECKPCPEGKVRNESGKCVMPKVTFTSLVLSLNTTALFHLGELAHPESGEQSADRPYSPGSAAQDRLRAP